MVVTRRELAGFGCVRNSFSRNVESQPPVQSRGFICSHEVAVPSTNKCRRAAGLFGPVRHQAVGPMVRAGCFRREAT
jgi:hypothetical protein